MITHHTQLIQALIDKHNLKSYLEIGVQNPANNFDRIKIKAKVGVDPSFHSTAVGKVNNDEFVLFDMTSDKFFSENVGPFDIIFIDGDHTADQVKRDFENSLACLSDNGFIVIHDTLPVKEETTHVPRDSKVWHGDVYKFIPQLWLYPGIKFKTFNIDEGCCLVWKENRGFEPTKATFNGKKWEDVNIDWNFYLNNKHLLNVVDEVII